MHTFVPLSHPFKASTVATAFMETIQKLLGNPKIIVSDIDPIFTVNVWKDIFVVLYLINKHNGLSGYLWLNGGITLPSILQQK